MQQELRILGPVVLILLAGYFASYPLAVPEPSRFSSLTGAVVVDVNSCSAANTLFKVSGQMNAHAEEYNQQTYTYAVCWQGTPSSSSRSCDGANDIVTLSGVTNAHVEQAGQGNYNTPVCYGNLRCTYSSSCAIGEQCVASLSGATNAHIGDCSSYPIKICCADGGGGSAKVDSDKDGVYDDGDGTGVGTNPCNPNLHSNFLTCDDNCLTITNGPNNGTCFGGANDGEACLSGTECPSGTCQTGQEDADSDGAGDVCDAFPTDSCSIVTSGDNCPSYSQCAQSLQATWDKTSATEGDDVGLTLTGDSSCEGLIFVFQVFDSVNPAVVEADPQPVTLTNGKATTTWQAEYHSGESNKYYFQATSQNNLQVSSPQTSMLQVSPDTSGGATCGDGKVQRSLGEECDKGSSNCQYTKSQVEGGNKTCGSSKTCYADCLLIPGSGGSSCTTDPKCQGRAPGLLAVCTSQVNKIQFCVRGVGGCLQLSNSQQCGRVGGVQHICVPNAPSCQSPGCQAAKTIKRSACQGGQQQFTCTTTSTLPHCQCQPGESRTVACLEEPKEDFPFFSGWNVLLTVLLLVTFYFFRKK